MLKIPIAVYSVKRIKKHIIHLCCVFHISEKEVPGKLCFRTRRHRQIPDDESSERRQKDFGYCQKNPVKHERLHNEPMV